MGNGEIWRIGWMGGGEVVYWGKYKTLKHYGI